MSWARVVLAVLELAGNEATLVKHTPTPWQSAMFDGVRHRFILRFEGESAVDAGGTMLSVLPHAEFNFPGQLLVKAERIWSRHETQPKPVLDTEIELLLLTEAKERAA